MITHRAFPGVSCICAALILAPLGSLWAGVASLADAPAGATSAGADAIDSTPAPSKLKTSYEFNTDASYVGDARTNFGSGSNGNVSEQNTDASFIVQPQFNDGPIYRIGPDFQRYSFGFSSAAPLPNILQSESLTLGVDFSLLNSWLFRVEVNPGLYSDLRATGFRDFNAPFIIGGSYIAGADLQWFGGLDVDINRQFPVIPAVGVRWSFTDNWVLNAVLPTPRLEYDWSKDLTLYLGGNVRDGTYRVDRDFGTALGRPLLNGAIVEYDEIRIGAGCSWKAFKDFTFELEGGYLPYREFDFHRADTHFSNDSGAPYGQMSLNAQF